MLREENNGQFKKIDASLDKKIEKSSVIITGDQFREIAKSGNLHNVNMDELLPDPYNRPITRQGVDSEKQRILSSGKVKPLIYIEVDGHTVKDEFKVSGNKPIKILIDGHHRWTALKEMGHKTAPAYKASNGILTADSLKPKSTEEKTTKKEDNMPEVPDKVKIKDSEIKDSEIHIHITPEDESKKFIIRTEDGIEKVVRREGNKWVLYSKDGSKKLGESDTKEGIIERERQVQYFKHQKAEKGVIGGLAGSMAGSELGRRVTGPTGEFIGAALGYGLGDKLTGKKPKYKSMSVDDVVKAWFGESERHSEAKQREGQGVVDSATKKPGSQLGHRLGQIGLAALGTAGVLTVLNPRVRAAILGNVLTRLRPAKIAGIATKDTLEQGGATVALSGHKPSFGFAVSPYKKREEIIPKSIFHEGHTKDYIHRNLDLLKQPGNHLGTWHNTETGNIHLDISHVTPDKQRAINIGRKSGQLAIFDLGSKTEIPIAHVGKDAASSAVNPREKGKTFLSKVTFETENARQFSPEDIKAVGDKLGVNWDKIDMNQLVEGTHVELEHADVTGGDLEQSVKIALAHIEEVPDYYTRLKDVVEYDKETKKIGDTLSGIGGSEVSVNQPNPSYAQPNNQVDIQRMKNIQQELINIHSVLQDIESKAVDQQLLTPDELNNIILPLKEETQSLLDLITPTLDYKPGEEECGEMCDPGPVDENTKNPQQRKKPIQEVGPVRQVGTAERDLTSTATTFVERSDNSGDIQKERGWRGDPEGHAASARDRWEAEGVPPGGKPKPVAERIAGTVGGEAKKIATKAGIKMRNMVASGLADVGMDALGTVTGIILWRFLNKQSINPTKLIGVARASTERGLKRIISMPRVKDFASKLKAARLAARVASIRSI